MRLRLACFGLVGLILAGCQSYPAKVDQTDWRPRINYYQKILTEHPERYPVRVQLAETYLEGARSNHDANLIREARRELDASMAIQSTFEACLTMAKVQSYSHRFADALDWADRASIASPGGVDTPEIVSLRVEAHLGLGQGKEVEQLLARIPASQAPFYWSAGHSAFLKAQGRWEDAAQAMRQAAAEAIALGSPQLATWAEISIAGCYLDAGHPESALPFLHAVQQRSPENRLLRMHWAEYEEATGSPEKAYAIYQSLLKEGDDPELHQKAYSLARGLGHGRKAQRHFQAAEKGYQKVLDAGEIYTLGALARLYTTAEVNLGKARELAQRNLDYCRDAEALAIYEALHSLKNGERL